MSLQDEVKNSMKSTAAVVAGTIGGCLVWTVGYNAGFEKALQQPQKPTVVFGTQIINNSNNYWSPDAGAVTNQETEKLDK